MIILKADIYIQGRSQGGREGATAQGGREGATAPPTPEKSPRL